MAVGSGVGVLVAVAVGFAVGVAVGVLVIVADAVGVLVDVAIAVVVASNVGVGVSVVGGDVGKTIGTVPVGDGATTTPSRLPIIADRYALSADCALSQSPPTAAKHASNAAANPSSTKCILRTVANKLSRFTPEITKELHNPRLISSLSLHPALVINRRVSNLRHLVYTEIFLDSALCFRDAQRRLETHLASSEQFHSILLLVWHRLPTLTSNPVTISIKTMRIRR